MEHRRHRIRARRQRFRAHTNPRPINPAGCDVHSQQRHTRGHRARANHGCRRRPTPRGSPEGNEDGDRANVYGGRFPIGASGILMRSNRQSESTGRHDGHNSRPESGLIWHWPDPLSAADRPAPTGRSHRRRAIRRLAPSLDTSQAEATAELGSSLDPSGSPSREPAVPPSRARRRPGSRPPIVTRTASRSTSGNTVASEAASR
jgi:hypothetical protein